MGVAWRRLGACYDRLRKACGTQCRVFVPPSLIVVCGSYEESHNIGLAQWQVGAGHGLGRIAVTGRPVGQVAGSATSHGGEGCQRLHGAMQTLDADNSGEQCGVHVHR